MSQSLTCISCGTLESNGWLFYGAYRMGPYCDNCTPWTGNAMQMSCSACLRRPSVIIRVSLPDDITNRYYCQPCLAHLTVTEVQQ